MIEMKCVMRYRNMVEVCVADGKVTEKERELVETYYGGQLYLTEEVHARCLESIGWTQAEWEMGRKKDNAVYDL